MVIAHAGTSDQCGVFNCSQSERIAHHSHDSCWHASGARRHCRYLHICLRASNLVAYPMCGCMASRASRTVFEAVVGIMVGVRSGISNALRSQPTALLYVFILGAVHGWLNAGRWRLNESAWPGSVGKGERAGRRPRCVLTG